MADFIVEDVRVDLDTGLVAVLIRNKWHMGRVHELLDGDGDITEDPGEAMCMIVQWDDDGRWSPICVEFDPVECSLH